MRGLFSMIIALALAGCGGGGGSNECTPGASASCTCTDGRSGAQSCRPDGTFGACSCTGGSNSAPPPANAKRVFVTSTGYPGDLGAAGGRVGYGLDGADKLCQSAADAAGLGGSFKAWVSSSSGNAIDRITSDGPWYLVDGTTKVFNNKANLATTPAAPINMDENGQTPVAASVWTGTVAGGRSTGTYDGDCKGWNWSQNYDVKGIVGSSDTTGTSWTSSAVTSFCTNQYRLYCFEL
jgi:hypothetical protein